MKEVFLIRRIGIDGESYMLRIPGDVDVWVKGFDIRTSVGINCSQFSTYDVAKGIVAALPAGVYSIEKYFVTAS